MAGTWAKGWRVVMTCEGCKYAIWSKNIGQTVKCKCEEPNYIMSTPNYYKNSKHKDNYALTVMKVEDAY